jgi:hypothetical protein
MLAVLDCSPDGHRGSRASSAAAKTKLAGARRRVGLRTLPAPLVTTCHAHRVRPAPAVVQELRRTAEAVRLDPLFGLSHLLRLVSSAPLNAKDMGLYISPITSRRQIETEPLKRLTLRGSGQVMSMPGM